MTKHSPLQISQWSRALWQAVKVDKLPGDDSEPLIAIHSEYDQYVYIFERCDEIKACFAALATQLDEGHPYYEAMKVMSFFPAFIRYPVHVHKTVRKVLTLGEIVVVTHRIGISNI